MKKLIMSLSIVIAAALFVSVPASSPALSLGGSKMEKRFESSALEYIVQKWDNHDFLEKRGAEIYYHGIGYRLSGVAETHLYSGFFPVKVRIKKSGKVMWVDFFFRVDVTIFTSDYITPEGIVFRKGDITGFEVIDTGRFHPGHQRGKDYMQKDIGWRKEEIRKFPKFTEKY